MTINEFPKVMVICLLSTVIIECSLAIIIGYRKKDLLNIFLANCLTNPIVSSIPVYFNYYHGLKARNMSLLILELLTLFVEGFIYHKYLKKRKINGYVLSLILNACSYFLGLLINKLIY